MGRDGQGRDTKFWETGCEAVGRGVQGLDGLGVGVDCDARSDWGILSTDYSPRTPHRRDLSSIQSPLILGWLFPANANDTMTVRDSGTS